MNGEPAGSTPVVTAHFNEVAANYDYWKNKNSYYYDALRDIARTYAGHSDRLLDVGCGTGAMLAVLTPKKGVGVDISPEMIEIAKRTHPEYEFAAVDITQFHPSELFDRILFFDVIEHVNDIPAAIKALARLLTPEGHLVLSMANPAWEPVLMLSEKWGLKMPEGPHHRIWGGELLSIAHASGLKLVRRDWRLLFPKYIAFVSPFINNVLGKIPLIRRASVVEVFIFKRS